LGGQNALRALELEIRRAESKLADLRQLAAEKRQVMVAAKQETASIEKLREHRLDEYNKDFRKSEEALIDELVSAARTVERQSAAANGRG
ncbi:MAG: flagellar FliJ family protein, partial [Oscillospiraceae bacterium]